MGPLDGVRVLEIASLAPAPFGVMLLADLGADVIRVDRASGGSPFTPPPGVLDRGRRTIALDLKTSEGVAAALRLAARADVLIEGFRPGVAERLGLGPAECAAVNPRLVYARMTGYGQDGPLASKAGHDINYLAAAGALEPLGRAAETPHPPINVLADFAGGGSFLAIGVIAALYEREHSGRGQVIDAAMVDGASVLMTFLHGMKATGQWDGARGTNLLDGGAAFYDTYETADGKYMAVGSVEPQFYANLLAGLELDPSTLPDQFDSDGVDELRAALADRFRFRTRDEWTRRFADLDACVTPVLSPWEAHEHPHNRIRRSFVEVGDHLEPAPAPRFSRTPTADPQPIDSASFGIDELLASWGHDE